jgi:hypothetical protein
MTLGTPDFDWPILPDDLTEAGLPLYADDSWNPNAALSGAVLISTSGLLVPTPVLDSADGGSHTIKVVFNCPNSGSIQNFIGQISFGPTKKSLYLGMNVNGTIEAQFWTSNSTLSSATSSLAYDDGLEHILVVTVAATQIEAYIDDTDLSMNTLNDAYTGMPASTPNATLGGRNQPTPDQNLIFGNQMSRVTVWATEAATSLEATEIYDDEIAAIGEGFSSSGGILSPIINPIISRGLSRII